MTENNAKKQPLDSNPDGSSLTPPHKDTTFSAFRAPVTNTKPIAEITLSRAFEKITGEDYRDVTKELRCSEDKSEIKKTKLDYVTFSGVFSSRSTTALLSHSGLICVDLDNLDDVTASKATLLESVKPSLVFTSPSGNGLKAVYKIDINVATHLAYYEALECYFKEQLSLEIDKSCKDVARACFLCYDSDAHYNEDAEVLDLSFIDTFSSLPEKAATKSSEPIAEDEIEKDPVMIIRKLTNWGTKKEGPFISGNRNNYISKLAYAYNRFGITLNDATNDLLAYAEDGFPVDEIKAIINYSYKKTSFHNVSTFKKENKQNPTPKKEAKTPLLPINGFSDYLQGFINEYVGVYNQPRDYIAASVLFSTALAIGDKMELDTGKYKNIPLLWMSIIGNVSSGKSEPLNFCLDYFAQKDKQARQVYETQKELYEAEQDKPKKERNSNIKAPFRPQYIIKDYTPEDLPNIHKANPRGLCIYNDELKSWLDNFSRYNKSGEQSTMLSLFYRADMVVNRVSKMHSINDPSIYVAGGLQIDLLSDLAKDGRAENGFLARLAHVFPDGNKKLPHSTATLSKKSIEGFHRYLHSLASLRDPIGLTLSSEASAVYTKWYDKNADLTNATDLGYLKGVYGKLDVYALRFAIVLHGMHSAGHSHYPTQISGETMQHAVEITEYFRATALKVHKHIKRGDKEVSKAAIIKKLSDLGHSQKAIAKMLDVSQPYVSKIIKD